MFCHFIENAKSTPTLITPTTIEGSKIWLRFVILEENKTAAKPAKVKKRNIWKDWAENSVSNIAPITVDQVAATLPWFKRMIISGSMAKGTKYKGKGVNKRQDLNRKTLMINRERNGRKWIVFRCPEPKIFKINRSLNTIISSVTINTKGIML